MILTDDFVDQLFSKLNLFTGTAYVCNSLHWYVTRKEMQKYKLDTSSCLGLHISNDLTALTNYQTNLVVWYFHHELSKPSPTN